MTATPESSFPFVTLSFTSTFATSFCLMFELLHVSIQPQMVSWSRSPMATTEKSAKTFHKAEIDVRWWVEENLVATAAAWQIKLKHSCCHFRRPMTRQFLFSPLFVQGVHKYQKVLKSFWLLWKAFAKELKLLLLGGPTSYEIPRLKMGFRKNLWRQKNVFHKIVHLKSIILHTGRLLPKGKHPNISRIGHPSRFTKTLVEPVWMFGRAEGEILFSLKTRWQQDWG